MLSATQLLVHRLSTISCFLRTRFSNKKHPQHKKYYDFWPSDSLGLVDKYSRRANSTLTQQMIPKPPWKWRNPFLGRFSTHDFCWLADRLCLIVSPTAAVSTLILEKRVRFRLTNRRVCRGVFAVGCLFVSCGNSFRNRPGNGEKGPF